MSFLTFAIVEEAFQRAPKGLREATEILNRRESLGSDAIKNIKERVVNPSLDQRFDVFLCHAAAAADTALGVWQLLSEPPYGFDVYVDWIHDPLMERLSVNQEIAEILRRRMQASQCLIYVVTEASQASVWMPWELGYFDAYKANIGYLPVVENENTVFSGHEYLSLYKPVTLEEATVMAKSPPSLRLDADAQAQIWKMAKAAQENLPEFVRQMQAEPKLAGEWLRPHAAATLKAGPEMSALRPRQATMEVKSMGSIYMEEWLKLFGIETDPGR